MAKKSILVADDLAERSIKGRLRSRLLRDSAVELAKKLKFEIDLLYVKNLNPGILNRRQIKLLENSFDDIANSVMAQLKKVPSKGVFICAPELQLMKFSTLYKSRQAHNSFF